MLDVPADRIDDGEVADLSQGLARCVAPVAEAYTLPPPCYHCTDVLKREQSAVFRHGWLPIGRADMVRNEGDYVTMDVAGISIIVLRDKKGNPRAFANTCRHRGAQLLVGEGTTDMIRCPFHCWTYRLSGELIGGAHLDQTENFDKADFGLIEFAVADRAGFLFVCLEDRAPDIDAQLGDFEELHAPWPLAGLASTRRREFEVGCNWKGFLEVFNEYYHLAFVHPDSLNDIYEPPDPADTVTGAYASQFGATEGTGGLLESQQEHALPAMPGLTGRAAMGARYTWIYPNLTFAAGTDALWVYEAYPLGPERSRVVQTICFPPETIAAPGFEARAAQYYYRLDAALDEDVPALENHHRGLRSPFAKPGRYSVLMEPNVASFAAWYAQRLLSSS